MAHLVSVTTTGAQINPPEYYVENGITKGTTATTFSPNTGCKRYQLVVFLNKFSNK